MARAYEHWIANADHKPSSRKYLERRSPAHGAVLAKFAEGSIEDVSKAVASAVDRFNDGESCLSRG